MSATGRLIRSLIDWSQWRSFEANHTFSQWGFDELKSMVSRGGVGWGGGSRMLHVALINSIFIHPRCLSRNNRNSKAIDLPLARRHLEKTHNKDRFISTIKYIFIVCGPGWLWTLTANYKLHLMHWNSLHNSGGKKHAHYCTMGSGHNLDLVWALKIAYRWLHMPRAKPGRHTYLFLLMGHRQT